MSASLTNKLNLYPTIATAGKYAVQSGLGLGIGFAIKANCLSSATQFCGNALEASFGLSAFSGAVIGGGFKFYESDKNLTEAEKANGATRILLKKTGEGALVGASFGVLGAAVGYGMAAQFGAAAVAACSSTLLAASGLGLATGIVVGTISGLYQAYSNLPPNTKALGVKASLVAMKNDYKNVLMTVGKSAAIGGFFGLVGGALGAYLVGAVNTSHQSTEPTTKVSVQPVDHTTQSNGGNAANGSTTALPTQLPNGSHLQLMTNSSDTNTTTVHTTETKAPVVITQEPQTPVQDNTQTQDHPTHKYAPQFHAQTDQTGWTIDSKGDWVFKVHGVEAGREFNIWNDGDTRITGMKHIIFTTGTDGLETASVDVKSNYTNSDYASVNTTTFEKTPVAFDNANMSGTIAHWFGTMGWDFDTTKHTLQIDRTGLGQTQAGADGDVSGITYFHSIAHNINFQIQGVCDWSSTQIKNTVDRFDYFAQRNDTQLNIGNPERSGSLGGHMIYNQEPKSYINALRDYAYAALPGHAYWENVHPEKPDFFKMECGYGICTP